MVVFATGHPPVVEAQAGWIADVLQGRLRVRAGIVDPPQRRVVQSFRNLRPNSLLIDRFAYPRLLAADRHRGTPIPASRGQRCEHEGCQQPKTCGG